LTKGSARVAAVGRRRGRRGLVLCRQALRVVLLPGEGLHCGARRLVLVL
jgi:hypothetical protein